MYVGVWPNGKAPGCKPEVGYAKVVQLHQLPPIASEPGIGVADSKSDILGSIPSTGAKF